MSDLLRSAPLLDIENATVYRGGSRILDNINIHIADGEHVAIVGPNGSGKSTLIKLITKQLYPYAGKGENAKVEIFGRDRWDIFELRSHLGILSNDLQQDYTSDDSLIAADVVISGFFASRGIPGHRKVTDDMISAAEKALKLAGGETLTNRKLAELSTGEARRVLIARALVTDPRALMLDEPTAGLDIIARRHFLQSIRTIAEHHKTVLLVTHHVEEIIPDGKVFRDGPKNELLTETVLTDLYEEPISVYQQGPFFSATSVTLDPLPRRAGAGG